LTTCGNAMADESTRPSFRLVELSTLNAQLREVPHRQDASTLNGPSPARSRTRVRSSAVKSTAAQEKGGAGLCRRPHTRPLLLYPRRLCAGAQIEQSILGERVGKSRNTGVIPGLESSPRRRRGRRGQRGFQRRLRGLTQIHFMFWERAVRPCPNSRCWHAVGT
jgi:hypothetical protein